MNTYQKAAILNAFNKVSNNENPFFDADFQATVINFEQAALVEVLKAQAKSIQPMGDVEPSQEFLQVMKMIDKYNGELDLTTVPQAILNEIEDQEMVKFLSLTK
jgi:hypothetical protein